MSISKSANVTQPDETVTPEMMAKAQAEVDRQFNIIINYSMAALTAGESAEKIVNELVEKGVDRRHADICVRHSILKLNEQQRGMAAIKEPISPPKKENPKKEAAKMQMLIGGLVLGLGGLITLVSYGMSEQGGKYILAYGAIIVGGWNVISGFWKYGNS